MTERHLIAYAILILLLLATSLVLWRRRYRRTRVRHDPERHLRIDLLADAGEEPL